MTVAVRHEGGRASPTVPRPGEVTGVTVEASLIDVTVAGARAVAVLEAATLAAVAQLVAHRTVQARRELLAWRRQHPGAAAARAPWEQASAQCQDQAVDEVVSEVAAALRMSERAARARVTFALDIVEITPCTWAALRDGRIDAARARRIVDALTPVHAEDRDLAARIEERLLSAAPDRTPAELAALAPGAAGLPRGLPSGPGPGAHRAPGWGGGGCGPIGTPRRDGGARHPRSGRPGAGRA